MQTVKPRMDCARYASWCQNGYRLCCFMWRGQGAGLASGFANLYVFTPPVPIWQNSGGNWLKCRNGSFVTLALILLPQKLRPKSHHGALNRLGKNRSGQIRSGKSSTGKSSTGKSGRGRSRSGTDWSGDHSRGVKIIFCRKQADHKHYAAILA
jgi:hypothetical protein